MKTLILGANGATGKHLVNELTKNNKQVKIIVRSRAHLPDHWKNNNLIEIIEKGISEVSIDEMSNYINDCSSIACCLGHNLTFKGIYGKPRKLVTDAVKLSCRAIEKSGNPVNFVLMNTTGNSNPDENEKITILEIVVVGLIRLLIPPHPDNEAAAEYLRKTVGSSSKLISWVVVRPDSLIDESEVSDYTLYKSPIRSAIFDPGKTSRINVGHFMSQLIIDEELFNSWKEHMPVIYNDENAQ